MRTNLQKIALLAVLFASEIIVLPSCAQKPQAITIGTTNSEVNSLLYLANEQGYFNDYGLNVTLKTYASGKAAIDGMLQNEVDMATGTEYAFAGNVLAGDNVRFISTIGRFTGEFLIARNDSGITKISDLRGKKIGVPMKSRPEFALGRFFDLNGIDSSTVTLRVGRGQRVDFLFYDTVE
jgi:NitT/TauT family transport system substrate-binding protein